jgi:hypothetical protein
VHGGTDEIITIRLRRRSVNAEMRVEFSWPSHECYFELRGGVVKAGARRVERSESLEDAEHSFMLAM